MIIAILYLITILIFYSYILKENKWKFLLNLLQYLNYKTIFLLICRTNFIIKIKSDLILLINYEQIASLFKEEQWYYFNKSFKNNF